MGDKSYPKRRLRTFSVAANKIQIYNTLKADLYKRNQIEVDGVNSEGEQLVVHFDTRKLVVSKDHEEIFIQSLFWPVKGQSSLRLRKDHIIHIDGEEPTHRIMKKDKVEELTSFVLNLPLQYQCYECTKWHTFSLMHSPRCSPDDFFQCV